MFIFFTCNAKTETVIIAIDVKKIEIKIVIPDDSRLKISNKKNK
tara:strand:+ start:100 stop:231 length:132 start_codon:yes stop_codon:yes gene_type:complete